MACCPVAGLWCINRGLVALAARERAYRAAPLFAG